MAIDLPGWIVDIRQPIAGDSFSWAGTEPAAAKKSLVFHHSASDAASEDGFSIADYHTNHNGWSGIGYHFVITRRDYPGRAGLTNPGAQVQYVGDLGTWRAHVLNQNPGRVGICFVGFTPDTEQLHLGRQLVDFLLAPNNILPSLNHYSQVMVHRLVPEQSTACPGDDFNNWLPYLQGGADPTAPPPAPTPPPPVDSRPEWEKTWNPTPVSPKVAASAVNVFSFPQNKVVKTLPAGEPIQNIVGSFTVGGQTYYQTKFSADRNLFNGILAGALKEPSITNVGVPVDSIQPPPTPPQVFDPGTPTLPEPKASSEDVGKALAGLWEALVGVVLSPLRLIGIITNYVEGIKK